MEGSCRATASRSGCSSCCLDHIQSELVLSALQCLASAVYVYVCVYLASERLIAMHVLSANRCKCQLVMWVK